MLIQPQGLNWLYFDLNSYFATIEQQVNPVLRGKPVAVVPMLTDSTCAMAASYEAKLKGIKTGVKIYEAKRLCPELICIPGRHKLYTEYHKRIFAEVNKLLYIDQIYSIDEGAGRLTGKYCNEQEAILLANQIKLAIKRNVGDYITCSIGIASTKYLAKIAAEMQKPDGLKVIKLEDIPNKLFCLKLRDIPGIGYRTLQKLNNSKISTIEQLYESNSYQLKTIWGNIYGKKIWYLLRGYEFPEYVVKNRIIGHSRILSPELRTTNKARDMALELILKAAKRLREKELYTTFIDLKIRTANKLFYKIRFKISPSCDSQTLSKYLLNAWDQLTIKEQINKLIQISISLSGLIKQPKQLTFGDIGITTKRHKLSVAMDKLNNKHRRDLVNLGMPPGLSNDDPIAFTNIPLGEGEDQQ